MEEFIFYVLVFVAGTVLGSFLNVVVDRLPFGQSLLFPASHCPHCRHKLAAFDLIPVFSFFYLRRRCRYCHARISWYYPFTEIFTGLLFVFTTFFTIGNSVPSFLAQIEQAGFLAYLFIIISILIVVFFIDLKYGIIPFRVILFALAIITVYHLMSSIGDYTNIFRFLLTGITVFLLFFLLFFLTKGRAIGFGDVFYSLMMGYFLGYPSVIVGVYIAFLTGAFISLILVLTNKKRLKGGTIPFGPFLVFGTIVALFWGDTIINMALRYLYVY